MVNRAVRYLSQMGAKGPVVELTRSTQRPLIHIVFLLVAARYIFLVLGAGFLFWATTGVLGGDESLTLRAAVEVALVLVLGPALVWVSSSWGERLVMEAKHNHDRVVEMNRVTQREIAERKRVEDELRKSEQRAVIALDELKKAQQTLVQAEKLTALGELVAGVAHELNNPLTGVLGFSQLLLRADLDPGVRSDIERIAWEAGRAARIVQNLLSFARMQDVQKQPVDLLDILARTVEIKVYDLRVSSIQVEMELAKELPPVLFDPSQLQAVFLNLINNAQDAMTSAHGRGTLWIRAEQVGGRIRVTIADDEPGVRSEHLTRIFDPFFTTKAVGKGTGLGLSICQGIVSGHGGRIWVESEIGKGATFTMELPVTHEAWAKNADHKTGELTTSVRGGNILVIDDEEVIRDLAVQVLGQAGYRVEARANAREVIESGIAADFDLLLLDIKMPDMDGKGILSESLFNQPRDDRPGHLWYRRHGKL